VRARAAHAPILSRVFKYERIVLSADDGLITTSCKGYRMGHMGRGSLFFCKSPTKFQVI
jgi:hypothetical protein